MDSLASRWQRQAEQRETFECETIPYIQEGFIIHIQTVSYTDARMHTHLKKGKK